MAKAGTNVNGLNHRELTAEICRAIIGNEAYLFHEQWAVKCAEVGTREWSGLNVPFLKKGESIFKLD
jgi:hypothetical protein